MNQPAKKRRIPNWVVGIYPLALVAVLGLNYVIARWIYWPGIKSYMNAMTCIAPLGLIPFVIVLFFSNLRPIWRIVISLLTLPLMCITSWGSLSYEEGTLAKQAEIHNQIYAVSYGYGEGGSGIEWSLRKCPKSGIGCTTMVFLHDPQGVVSRGTSPVRIVTDPRSDEVHILLNDQLFFTEGQPSRQYIVNVSEDYIYGTRSYHIARDESHDPPVYSIYECDRAFTCKALPFRYAIPKKDRLYQEHDANPYVYRDGPYTIEIDQTNGNLSFKLYTWSPPDWIVVFTYDGSPHCHVEGCSIVQP